MTNPLAKYLRNAKLPQKVFADRINRRQATVSGWCNQVIPSIPDALLIEAATGGEVSTSDWAAYAATIGKYTPPRIEIQDHGAA